MTQGWMEGRTDRKMSGLREGQMSGGSDERTEVRIDQRTEGRINGRTVEWNVGPKDGEKENGGTDCRTDGGTEGLIIGK